VALLVDYAYINNMTSYYIKLSVIVLVFVFLASGGQKTVADSTSNKPVIKKQVKVVKTISPKTNWSKVKDLFK